MRYILIFIILFFSSCSIKNYEHTESKIIVIKTPNLKFSDLGYVRNRDKNIELELYSAGKVVKRININHLICIDDGCIRKESFNEEYLCATYPDEILQNIILGHQIYDGENMFKTSDGFVQNIIKEDVEIEYIVDSKQIYFKDKKNAILFKIKDVK